MPLPPDIPDAQTDDPYTGLGDVQYSAPTTFFAHVESMLQNNFIKKMWDAADANPNIAELQQFSDSPQVQKFIDDYNARKPATQDEINQAQTDRPGFQAPKGVSKTVLDILSKNWDDSKYFEFTGSRPASTLGKVAGFAGDVTGGFLDPVALTGGGLASNATERVLAPWAKGIMNRMAVSETMGSMVPQVATQVLQTGLITGAGFGGYQATEELADEYQRGQFNQPSDWLGALQRVGSSAAFGATLGGAARIIGIGLFGYDRPFFGEPEKTTTETGSEDVTRGEERVGGLLNSDAFADMTAKAKSTIGKVYKPWSDAADSAAREDAIGQAINGNTPNVDLTLKQGAVDAGSDFRQAMKSEGISLSDLDFRLDQADEEANKMLDQLNETRRALVESDKKLSQNKDIGINENKDLSQKGLLDRFEKSQFNPEMMENAPETMPENINKYAEIQSEINRLNNKINVEGENKKVRNRITQLKKRLPKIETPKEELEGIKKRLLDKGLPENHEETTDYKRLTDLSKVWKQAGDLLNRVKLEADHKMQLQELLGRKVVIDSMKKHVNGTHNAVTPQEVQAYANRLNSIDMEPVNYDLPDSIDTTYSEELDKLAQEELTEMLNKIDLPEFKAEIEDTARQRELLPTLKQMAKGLVNCILGNEV